MTDEEIETNHEDEPDLPQSNIKRRNDLIGSPSDVALLRYVEMNTSVEGIRQRFHVSFHGLLI